MPTSACFSGSRKAGRATEASHVVLSLIEHSLGLQLISQRKELLTVVSGFPIYSYLISPHRQLPMAIMTSAFVPSQHGMAGAKDAESTSPADGKEPWLSPYIPQLAAARAPWTIPSRWSRTKVRKPQARRSSLSGQVRLA